MRKIEIMEKLKELGVTIEDDASAAEARVAKRQYIFDNVRSQISSMAEQFGQKIARTPSYYCELQPIELVWAEVKGQG